MVVTFAAPTPAYGSCQNKSELAALEAELEEITARKDARINELDQRGKKLTNLEYNHFYETIRALKKDIRVFKSEHDLTCEEKEDALQDIAEQAEPDQDNPIHFGGASYSQEDIVMLLVLLLQQILADQA